MTRATLRRTRFICLGVILALFCSVVEYQPAWAADDDEETGGDYKDPTIVTDDSSSVPQGVKDLGKKEKKPILNPVYGEWYFWAAAAVVAAGWVALAVWPGRQKAAKCVGGDNGPYSLGCIGDGR
jgi:hypothetical protein